MSHKQKGGGKKYDTKCHIGGEGGGVLKVRKMCHVLFEWPLFRFFIGPAQDEYGQSILHRASCDGKMKCVKLLIDNNARYCKIKVYLKKAALCYHIDPD